MALTDKLTAIADAIREKTGSKEPMTLEEMPAEIASISGSAADSIADGLLQRTLTEIRNTTATSIGEYALNSYAGLLSVEFTAAATIGTRAFASSASLTTAIFPAAVSMSTGVFASCKALKRVDFSNMKGIGSYAFEFCSALDTLILRKSDGITPLVVANAFAGTPFYTNGTGGTVYVPAALIEAYQTATNWSSLYAAGTCNFVAIEGSEYE